MKPQVVSLNVQPYIGYRFLDYEVYRVDEKYIWVVNWVNSQTKIYEYTVNQSGGA